MKLHRIVTVLALALTFGACSDQAGTDRLLAPDQGVSESKSWKADRYAIANGQSPSFEKAGTFVEKTIGPDGGFLYLDLHYLYVPQGAVTGPTVFRVTTLGNGDIGADFTATSVGSRSVNNVGRAGFKRPVYVAFSYAYARNAPRKPKDMKVLWFRPDGKAEVQPTHVDTNYRYAVGTLKHFSPYGLGWAE